MTQNLNFKRTMKYQIKRIIHCTTGNPNQQSSCKKAKPKPIKTLNKLFINSKNNT